MSIRSETMRPLISIIIPFHNAQRTLKKALLSLIDQDFPKDNYEIILVDDGSTDNSVEEIRKVVTNSPVPVKIVQQKHKGCYSARNLGAKIARGEILAFIDADEVANPNWLRFLVQPFLHDENVHVVCGRVITDEKALLPPFHSAPIDSVGRFNGQIRFGTCNIAFRITTFAELGGFDEAFDPILRGDTDLGLRALRKGFKVLYEPRAVVFHPVKKLSFISSLKLAWYRHHDVLLYKKHGTAAIGSLGNIMFQPIFRIASPASIMLVSLVAVVALVASMCSLNAALLFTLALMIFWVIFFQLFGYKLLLLSEIKPTKFLRFKTSIYLIPYTIVVVLARVYGSLKYRKLLL
ncbi:MAG: glycosyltransferase family 2 protein [Candidatus Odinarchaeota archaeon]|nr:glycosyltransferase family 2 protein [Candidatus Odinarchaeota archaeon]